MARMRIDHVTIICLDEEERVIEGGRLAVEDGRIRHVGHVPEDFVPDEIVDGKGAIVAPALFNAHCHSPMTFERGWAEDLPLDRWFNEKIWVAESALTEDDVFWGAQLAACEMIRSGCVGFNDHYFHMDRVAETVEAAGMKASLAWCVFGIGDDKEVGANLDGTMDFVRRWQGKAQGRIRPVLGPHSPYLCPPDFLREVARRAKEHDLPLHLHVSEALEQVSGSLDHLGKTPVAHVDDCGCFDVPCTLAHALYLEGDDRDRLTRSTVTVAHCPSTYMKLAMGCNDVEALHAHGVRIALGTDGPASNDDMDMLATLHVFAMLQKHVARDAAMIPGDLALRFAATNGAIACGFPESGRIVEGAAADLMFVATDRPHMRPLHDPVALVVHCAHGGDVCHLMADGRWIMKDFSILGLDEERILAEADGRARAMVGKTMNLVREYRG